MKQKVALHQLCEGRVSTAYFKHTYLLYPTKDAKFRLESVVYYCTWSYHVSRVDRFTSAGMEPSSAASFVAGKQKHLLRDPSENVRINQNHITIQRLWLNP